MRTSTPLALVLVLLAAPAGAAAGEDLSLTLGVFGGVSRYDVAGLQRGIATQGRDLLQATGLNAYGASVLLRLGVLDLGALYEGRVIRSGGDTAVLTPVAGLAVDLGQRVRLDLLAELGGHQVSNIQFSGSVDVTQARAVWLPYVGLRPTLTVRLPAGPVHLVAAVAPFARWDLLRRRVDVTVTDGTTAQTSVYDVGGATFGLAAGVGVEL
jgi:hypothetical protein